jgi:hypothetical protein
MSAETALMRYLTLMFVVLAASVTAAQTPDRRTTPGFWREWQWDASASDAGRGGVTAVEVKAFVGKLLELREVLKAAPAVAEPRGFNAYLQGHFNGFSVPERPDLKAREFPLAATLWFGAFPQEFDAAGNLTRQIGETELLPFEVNMRPPGAKPRDWTDINTDVIIQPAPHPDVAGLPRFGDALVFKKNPKPLWSPVSVETSLQLMLAQRQKDVKYFEDAAVRIRESYEEWVDPARVAARAQRNRSAAASRPDPEAYLANVEKGERNTEDTLKKQVAQDADPAANKFWAAAIARVKDVDETLASMSAADKASPACYLEPRGRVVDERAMSRLVPLDTPGCLPVVRPNWSYFDRALPRTSIQVITIGMIGRCVDELKPTGATRTWGCPVNLALLRSVDWDKVRSLLDR